METSTESPRLIISGSEAQLAFWESDAKFRALVGGIGSGKSLATCVEILRQPAGSTGAVVAPTFDMLRKSTLELFLEKFRPFIRGHNKGLLITTLINGTTIYWRSGEREDSLRGMNLSWFAIDEGAFCSPSVWQILVGRLRRSPSRGWVTTTPNGTDNWVYDTFVKQALANTAIFRSRSSDNVHLPADYVDSVRSQYSTAMASQELDGEFIDLSSARVKSTWFKYANFDDIPSDLPIYLGVDLAISEKTTADYTAIVASCYDPDTGIRYVLDAQHKRASFHEVLRFIEQMANKWNPHKVYVEAVAYQSAVVQELRRTTSLPVEAVTHRTTRLQRSDKLSRFLPVEGALEHGLVVFVKGLPDDFEKELLSFPNGGHDDFVDALGMSLQMTPKRKLAVAF